jgi:homoserine kinase
MKVKVTSPMGVGNIVCGFDVLGMVLNEPAEIIEVELRDDSVISIKHLDDFGLPSDADKNVAGVALKALLNEYDKPVGFDVSIEKLIKPGSGLGSSAASAAGAVVAANHLLGNIFSKEKLVQFAMEGEQLASGGLHADNIAPCIYGGINLIRAVTPLDVTVIPSPDVYVTLVHPYIQIKTSEARAILPKEVPLHKAIDQWANIAALVASFYTNDIALMSRALNDVLIEPVRSKLIPHFDEVKKKALEAGAFGGGISGSGPSIFMMSVDEITAKQVEKTMKDTYTKAGIEYKTYVTTINKEGVKVIE